MIIQMVPVVMTVIGPKIGYDLNGQCTLKLNGGANLMAFVLKMWGK